MKLWPGKFRLSRKWWIVLACAAALLVVCGCQTINFYCQAAKGQYQLLAHRQPLDKMIANPQTPPRLKKQLEVLQKLRTFAEHDLKLPLDGHYAKYVDVHRPFVVWNVEASHELSMARKSWWYPLVGSLDYRGYFSERGARDYAKWLAKKGYDVYVGGVEAYSTLGWFTDPALNTFIFNPEAELAETIFHELGHQQVFARGDTDFNEAFATAVGEEGARRWLRAKGDQLALENYLAELQRTRQFVALIATTRQRLENLFNDERTEEGKVKPARKSPGGSVEELRREKQAILEQLQREYAELKAKWGGTNDYDEWFARDLNNAKLNSVAAYYDLVPGFERLLESTAGDLPKFYKAAEGLANKPRKERHQSLRVWPK